MKILLISCKNAPFKNEEAALAWLQLSYIVFNLQNNTLSNDFILLQNWIFCGRIGPQTQILLIEKNI